MNLPLLVACLALMAGITAITYALRTGRAHNTGRRT